MDDPNNIKAKFKTKYILWFIYMGLSTLALLFLIGLFVNSLVFKKIEVFPIIMLFILSLIVLVLLVIFKDFKYITVNKEKQTITWFSIFYFLGKTYDLNSFIGLIKSVEHGAYESYRTVHLIDKYSKTAFKINGLFYENFDEIYEAIQLKEIKNYDFNFWKYIQLIVTGRMKIMNKNASLNN